MIKFTDTGGNEVWINTRNVTRVFTHNGATAIEVAGADRFTLVPDSMQLVAAVFNQSTITRLT